MAWIKIDSAKTVEDVVLRNTKYPTIEEFLNGSKPTYWIKYLTEAADMIKEAIRDGLTITIVGDYDADGVNASAILALILKSLGANVKVRLPKRLSEGFGLSTKIVDEIDDGLLITVDNGIVAFEAVKLAKEKGLKVIITDHHLLDESGELPEADIIIDPHIEGTADFADYCGAGIAYKLAQELTDDKQLLKKVSCFAAIGTICDVMPLIEENRLIVIEGLKNMTTYNCRTSGLYSLLRETFLDRKITEKDVAFTVGPILNAPGRLFDDGAMKSFEVIVYDGPFKESIGKNLVEINEERKRLVSEGMEKITKNIQMNCLHGDYPLVIYEPDLPEGIVGILAGRLAEEKNVPTIVLTDSEDPAIYKGSARSACGIHLKNLLDTAADKLYKYGGHAEAAGLSVKAIDFDDLKYELSENIPEPVEKIDKSKVYYDLEIDISEIDSMLKILDKYAPFGEGNPRIIFKVNNFELSPRYSSFFNLTGADNQHIKLFGNGVDAIAYNMAQRYMDLGEPKHLNLIGNLEVNNYMGRSTVQVSVTDMDDAGFKVEKSSLAKMLEARAKARYS